ncbi:MAG: hypothetical protein JEZ08_02175 [Clostridiales bacterium]|nr:hypothetical protein [Clostridiales bacterium]
MDVYIKNTISSDEVNYIRASVGFRQIHPEQVQNSLNGSSLLVSEYHEDEIVGMSRLIWDGGSVALIVDLLVIPKYQMKDIEEKMITHIFDFLRKKLKPGFGIQVDIRAWGNQENKFEEIGFQKSLAQRRGIPMHICLTKQIELTDAMFKQCDFEASNENKHLKDIGKANILVTIDDKGKEKTCR